MIEQDNITIRQCVVNSFRLTWSSTLADQTFTIWRNDVKILETKANTAVFTGAQLEGGIIQILDSEERFYSAKSNRLALAWDALDETDHYIVERKVDGDYQLLTVVDQASKSRHNLDSPPLDDEATHEFRVTGVGVDGNEGTPAELTHVMARHPDWPAVGVAWSDVTKVATISLAT